MFNKYTVLKKSLTNRWQLILILWYSIEISIRLLILDLIVIFYLDVNLLNNLISNFITIFYRYLTFYNFLLWLFLKHCIKLWACYTLLWRLSLRYVALRFFKRLLWYLARWIVCNLCFICNYYLLYWGFKLLFRLFILRRLIFLILIL